MASNPFPIASQVIADIKDIENPYQEAYRLEFERTLAIKLQNHANWDTKTKQLRIYVCFDDQLLTEEAQTKICEQLQTNGFGAVSGEVDLSGYSDSYVEMHACLFLSHPPTDRGDKSIRYSAAR